MTIVCPCCGEEICDEFVHCPVCKFEVEKYRKEPPSETREAWLAKYKAEYNLKEAERRLKEKRQKEREEEEEREKEELRKQREAEEIRRREARRKGIEEMRQKAKEQEGQVKTGGALKVSPLKLWQDFNTFKVLITQNLISGIWTLSLGAIVVAVISLDKPEAEARVLIGLGVALAVRVILEFVVVLFSIANSLHEIKEELCQGREKKDTASKTK